MSLIRALLILGLATPEPTAPTAVRLQLDEPANGEAVLVTCRRGATTCARALTFDKATHEDEVAWAVIAPIVDEVAASPLMAASSPGTAPGDPPSGQRWQIRIGDRSNLRAVGTHEHRWAFAVLQQVLASELVVRPRHPPASIDVERYVQRDPASEVRRVSYRCDADALWCRGDETRWGVVEPRWLEWRRLAGALSGEVESALLGASTFALSDTRPRRWSWRLQVGDRTSPASAADHLPSDALRLLDDLFERRTGAYAK